MKKNNERRQRTKDKELQFQQITRNSNTKQLATTFTSKTFKMEYNKVWLCIRKATE